MSRIEWHQEGKSTYRTVLRIKGQYLHAEPHLRSASTRAHLEVASKRAQMRKDVIYITIENPIGFIIK